MRGDTVGAGMRPVQIVVDSPFCDDPVSVATALEQMFIEALIMQPNAVAWKRTHAVFRAVANNISMRIPAAAETAEPARMPIFAAFSMAGA